MKKRFLFLFFGFCCLSVCVAQNAHFYLKDGVRLTLDVSVVDSITYLKPEAEVLLPTSCTLEAGTDAKFTYMVSDGLQYSPIEWSSTDSRIAYFSNDYLVARKAGKCIIYATYKGVTSSCVVTVMPSATINLRQLVSYAPLASYASAEIGVYMSQALTTGENSATGAYPYSQGWDFLAFSNPFWNWYSTELVPMAQQVFDRAGYCYNPNNGQYEVVHGTTGRYELPQCNAILIARTILLMSTMLATDIYGDIPLAELGYTRTPKYETQQEVYDWMFKEVDELLHHYQDPGWVNCSTNMEIDYAIDPIYGGDLTQWEAFCKGLKARLWLRKLPNWDNTPAVCQEIIHLVDDALANWEEPRYNYPGYGVLEDICPWGPYAPSVGGLTANRLSSSIPTTFFLHGTLGSIDGTYQKTRGYALDPRAAKIMDPRNQIKGMLHLESNVGMDINNTMSDFPDLLTQSKKTNPYTSNTGYVSLMTTEELMFIKAEAQYWVGDITGAYFTTCEATKQNMARYGINESLLSGNELNQYNRFFEIKLNQYKFTIADLMQQKYVAMYLQPEQWADMRRYNYSSSANGIAYAFPGVVPVYVYDVKNVHNGINTLFSKDAPNFCLQYSLHRPYNLYEAYWCTSEDLGVNASLSPNAWVARILHTPNMFNISELYRMGYYTENANGDKVLDYRMLKKRMIWAQKNSQEVTCADDDIEWK